MHLDDSVMQCKTVCTIIEVLKEARTITKNNTRQAKDINEKIEFIVSKHTKAMDAVRAGKKPDIKRPSHSLGIYRVNL
jgi:ribosomal protein L7/L12